jgi:hypothetical protein
MMKLQKKNIVDEGLVNVDEGLQFERRQALENRMGAKTTVKKNDSCLSYPSEEDEELDLTKSKGEEEIIDVKSNAKSNKRMRT